MTDTEIIDWLETAAKRSPTGISFDHIPSVDGEPSGFRFMRKWFISEPHKTLRSAVRAARDQIEGKPIDLPVRETET